jgi:hypothetical protein
VEPQVFHSEQTEQQDERIEGLEAMMAKMQRALKVLTTKIKSSEFHVYYLTSSLIFISKQKMARKLKHVENLCLDKPAASRRKHGSKNSQTICQDSDGISWQTGESWEKDKCTECSCQVR